MNRKKFLQSIIGASAFLSTPFSSIANDRDGIHRIIEDTARPVDGSMFGFKTDPIKKLRVGFIGVGNRGGFLLSLLEWFVKHNQVEVMGICDIRAEKVEPLAEMVKGWQKNKPQLYTAGEDDWKRLAQRDDVDLLFIATPWRYHAPMCIYGMKQGRHVATEVPAAYTLSECWELIETAEKTRRHCIMMENCCFNGEELFVLNMIERGVFGDITHTEGAYIHDLRAHMFDQEYYQGQWRLQHHIERDGNFYTTHGLGPIGFYLNIGRGDTFDYLTSMSSRELNLSRTAKEIGAPFQSFKCGDMNTTMIKTKAGKTIMLQFDVHSGSPYSRINKVLGTKAMHDGYPSRLYIDKDKPTFSGHRWLAEEEYQEYRSKYEHPIFAELKHIEEKYKIGHGGMDFVMIYRLITCLNQGLPLDINLYDGVLWSAVTPLSELSVASQSLPISVPDFTGGIWKNKNKLEVMRTLQ